MGVSKKSVSWTSTFVTTVLQEDERRNDVTFLVHTFWTPPHVLGLLGLILCARCFLPHLRLATTTKMTKDDEQRRGQCLLLLCFISTTLSADNHDDGDHDFCLGLMLVPQQRRS